MTKAYRHIKGLGLLLIWALIASVGCSAVSLGPQFKKEPPPRKLHALSNVPKDPAEVEKDRKACNEYATKSTKNYYPEVVKKHPDDWIEMWQERTLGETDYGDWVDAWRVCMRWKNYTTN